MRHDARTCWVAHKSVEEKTFAGGAKKSSQHVAKHMQQLNAAALAAGPLTHLLRAHQSAPDLQDQLAV